MALINGTNEASVDGERALGIPSSAFEDAILYANALAIFTLAGQTRGNTGTLHTSRC
jgi:hypothetical protein